MPAPEEKSEQEKWGNRAQFIKTVIHPVYDYETFQFLIEAFGTYHK